MTKLAQIIDGATSDDVSISSLLRMVKVVAARLEADQLIAWVDHELGGYGKEDPLPAYRGPHPTEVMGVFVGPFNSTLTLAVPRVQLPQRVQDAPAAFVVCFRQPVSELEPLSKATDQLQSAWPAEWVSYINGAIDRGEIDLVRMHHLQRAYQTITPPEIRGVLDAVRTRVLDLALALERLHPAAGEPEVTVDPAAVSTIVTNNFYGDGHALQLNSPGATQTVSVVKRGDLQGLLTAAAAAGLPVELVDELGEAIRADREAGSPDGEAGPHVTGFLGRLALGTSRVSGKLALGAGGAVIGSLIKGYLGIA